ncbi:MAG: DUF1552 domain-containing protein [Bradymonadaceae bacterium]|nr:DUF1552 domain-containing protein [Lujinxingiaceae bacterium]
MRGPKLSRRTFLGGAGALVALPMLEAMLPSMGYANPLNRPRRLLYYYVPCGIHMQAWTPTAAGSGAAWALSETLQPLAGLKSDLNVITNLANRPGTPDGPGDHAAGTGSFLTCSKLFKTEGANIKNGISVDQVAANAIGSQTRFASLELGLDGGGATGNCDSGYSCAYARNISWADEQTPLPKTVEPRLLIDRLFAGADPRANQEQAARRRAYRKSVLDYVTEDANKLNAYLGYTDSIKMEQYLHGIRELELSIENLENAPVCDQPDALGTIPDQRIKSGIMNDLMVLAMKCDATRIITFMLGNAGSNRSHNFIGISEGHHQLSHHESLQANYDKLKVIDRWEVSEFADLLTKMKAEREPDGSSLLDNSLVFFSSEISDGNRHNHNNLPVLLAGKAGGVVETDRHIQFAQETAIADLYISMLRGVNVNANSFGDNGTRTLPEILA